MKPSNHRALTALLWFIPVTLYFAAMGWRFSVGMIGFIVLNAILSKLIVKILPPVAAEKK